MRSETGGLAMRDYHINIFYSEEDSGYKVRN